MKIKENLFWEILDVISIFFFCILSILGIFTMITKNFFEGFVIMALSIIIAKLIIREWK